MLSDLFRFLFAAGMMVSAHAFNSNLIANTVVQDPVPDRIINLCKSNDELKRIRGFVELAEFDGDLEKAVPVLIVGIRSNDPGISESARWAVRNSGDRLLRHIKPLLESKDWPTFRDGCELARSIGPPSSKFVDLISSRINWKGAGRFQNNFTVGAMVALAAMGEKAEPALGKVIACLDSGNMNIRNQASKVIAAMGPTGKPAAEKLIHIVKNGNTSTRGWAAQALASIGTKATPDIVEIIQPLLNGFTTIEKERALAALAMLGSDAKTALPQIKELMENNKYRVQAVAAFAYWRISGENDRPVEILLSLTESTATRHQAIETLGRMGSDAANDAAIDYMIERLAPDDLADEREVSVIAIGNFGPKAIKALPALEKICSEDDDWLIRAKAKIAIAKIKSGHKPVAEKDSASKSNDKEKTKDKS
jgi:HEAT repeat protein